MNLVMASFGFIVVRAAPAEGYRNVLITGLGRSGTSAITSVLRNAGFYLGDIDHWPQRIEFVECEAIDEQRLPTMKYGFRS